ncbi:MAG: type I glyceraldehyde-3-phosphate dehydrogenase [Candidatus Puniceispirillaceae bacterium]
MTTRIAINGFGRIGRLVLRSLIEAGRNDVEVVSINSPGATAVMAHLLEFDSTHGHFEHPITFGDDWMDVGKGKLTITHERDPSVLPHAAMDVDIVLECSGRFNSRDKASSHLSAGAKKVLVSAPAFAADFTVVYGVNHDKLRDEHLVVSNASCTTNCLAPMAKVMHTTFGMISGNMTTIHAYTGDQNILDNSHKDLRRARSGGRSIVPTTTGAARAVGLVLPELDGRLDGSAVRVPTDNVSVVDLHFYAKTACDINSVNAALRAASAGPMKGILDVNELPLVSIDFNHNSHSCVADLTQTQVQDERFVRIMGWYDNEWGFANRMLDTAVYMNQLAKG